MDLLAQLEAEFESLIARITVLEEDNQRLRVQLEREQGKRDEIQARVETLLAKVRENIGQGS
jgi:cell division protein ZapB